MDKETFVIVTEETEKGVAICDILPESEYYECLDKGQYNCPGYGCIICDTKETAKAYIDYKKERK